MTYAVPRNRTFEEVSFLHRVFGWMAVGLFITGLLAAYLSVQEQVIEFFENDGEYLLWGILAGELLLVFSLAAFVSRMSPFVAGVIFLLYAALNGVSFSLVFAVYTPASIFVAFLVTAGMFGAMALYGAMTKRDLSGMGSILFMALIGLILASIVNIFWASSALYWLTTFAGVAIFCGLTAYDMQKVQKINELGNTGTDADKREAIMGALALYLDFINLFLYMLRLFGKRR